MIPADHVRPHERRRDNTHDGNSDDPEAGEQQVHTTSKMNVRSANVHNVGMVMFDRPHVVEIHTLKTVRVYFLQRGSSSRSIR
jgi:hypothetical protein